MFSLRIVDRSHLLEYLGLHVPETVPRVLGALELFSRSSYSSKRPKLIAALAKLSCVGAYDESLLTAVPKALQKPQCFTERDPHAQTEPVDEPVRAPMI